MRDEGVAIGALKIDCATGAGTITRFEPLANGSLYLENADGTEGYSNPFPITFGTVVNPSNAKTWKIYVNGTLVSNAGFRIGKDGKAYFRKGFVFVFQ